MNVGEIFVIEMLQFFNPWIPESTAARYLAVNGKKKPETENPLLMILRIRVTFFNYINRKV